MNKFVIYIRIKEALETAFDFQELEEALSLIRNFALCYPDETIIKRFYQKHEIAVIRLCGTL